MQGPRPNDVPVTPSIAICIPTCGRPSGLKKLLGNIAKLHYGGRISVIVVENELTARAGEAVVKDASSAYPWPLVCEVEKVPGQTYAYNRAFVSACRLVERPDYIAVRGAASTGFRAPTPGQQYLQNVAQNPNLNPAFARSVDVRAVLPSNSVAAGIFGGRALKPEESVNLSLGLVLQPLLEAGVIGACLTSSSTKCFKLHARPCHSMQRARMCGRPCCGRRGKRTPTR